MILLVTGLSGSGKTRRCERAASLVSANGQTVSGLLCPGVICPGVEADGERVRILAKSLPDGETRVLAQRRSAENTTQDTALVTPRWSFEPEVVAWADAKLATIEETDLLIIDELGPLEFERGEGFLSAFPLLDRGAFRLAMVVVRPSLLPTAQTRWPGAKVHDVTVDPEAWLRL